MNVFNEESNQALVDAMNKHVSLYPIIIIIVEGESCNDNPLVGVVRIFVVRT